MLKIAEIQKLVKISQINGIRNPNQNKKIFLIFFKFTVELEMVKIAIYQKLVIHLQDL